MKIYGIILYKTPLSNSYENVFDTDQTIGSQHTYSLIYKRFLENYEHTEVVVDLKSINRNNDSIIITLPYDYDTLHDYNYCCLWYSEAGEQTNKFYFITSLKEKNSTPNPACTIELEYDIFSNNFYDYKYGNYNKNCLTSLRHLERFEYDNVLNDFVVNSKYPVGVEDAPTSTASKLARLHQGYDRKYAILFERIAVDNSIYFNHGDNGGIRKQSSHDFGNSYSYLNYVFYPVAIYDLNGLINVTSDFGSKVYAYERVQGITAIVDLNVGQSQFSYFFESHFLYGSYTFNPPFSYHIVIDENKNKKIYLDCYVSGAYEGETSILQSSERYAIVESFSDGAYTLSNSDFLSEFNLRKPSMNVYYFDRILNYDNEPTFFAYPWKYDSVFVNGEFNNIVFASVRGQWQFGVIPRGECSNYNFRIHNGNDDSTSIYDLQPYNVLNYNGTYPIYNDKYEVFIRNNGNSFNTNYQISREKAISNNLSAFKSAAGVALGVYTGNYAMAFGSALSGLQKNENSFYQGLTSIKHNEEMHRAQIKDLKNSLDDVQIPSQFCNNDRYIQDRPLIFVNYGVKDREFNKLCLKLHLFGTNCDNYYDITHNSRKHFDYIQATCDITSIANLDDRKKFNSIFLKGVRLWHFDSVNSILSNGGTDFYNAFMSFNTTISNNEKFFYTEE